MVGVWVSITALWVLTYHIRQLSDQELLQICGFLESIVVRKTSELLSYERRNLECAGLASFRF